MLEVDGTFYITYLTNGSVLLLRVVSVCLGENSAIHPVCLPTAGYVNYNELIGAIPSPSLPLFSGLHHKTIDKRWPSNNDACNLDYRETALNPTSVQTILTKPF